MRQVLVLRIHTDGALVLTKMTGSQLSLEGVVVALVTCYLQRLYREYLLLAVLVEQNVNLLQTYCIIETLLVDNELQRVLLTSFGTGRGEVPLR